MFLNVDNPARNSLGDLRAAYWDIAHNYAGRPWRLQAKQLAIGVISMFVETGSIVAKPGCTMIAGFL